jgi:translation initiation factor eIF-2B subunit beta
VLSACRTSESVKLIERVQSVGRRLIAAQPREMVVGNVVRRVLGLIREEADGDHDAEFALSEAGSESQPQTPRAFDG